MRYGFKAKAERISADARRLVGLSDIAPLPARDLAKAMQVPVFGPRDIPGLPEEVAAQLLFAFERCWSGVTIPVNGTNVIVHNTNHLPERQESTIMHELAHIICEHKPAQIEPPGKFPWASRSYDTEQENQANWLGACLQIPRCALVSALAKRLDNLAIAAIFGASLQMVRYRRNVSGVDRELVSKLGMPTISLPPTEARRPKRTRTAVPGAFIQAELF